LTLLAPLIALALAGAPAAAAAPASPASTFRFEVNRVAALVNGDVITMRELERAGGSALNDANLLPPGPDRDKARAQALRAAFDLLVADRLFAQQVKKLDLGVSDAQVDAQVEAIKTQNHFSDAQLEEALSTEGLNLASFRDRVRNQLQNYAVLQYKVQGKVKVSDQDLENYYRSHPREFDGDEEVHLRHIFLPLPPGAGAAELSKVQAAGEALLGRLKKGEDFAKLAREASKGPSAENGGDLGWLKRGSVQKALEDAAFGLQPGQVSGLVRVGNGIHILQVLEHRKLPSRAFADVKETIRDRLVQEQAESYRAQFVAELRRDAVIETHVPELAQP
jgi:peptidyl-prolyl cis-trans isomerase SurA